MYAVLLQEQDGIELDEEKRLSLTSAIINYSKGGNQRKRFDSVEQMLELKRQQKVHFSNVFIATKSATNTAVKERLHLAIIRDDPAKICNFFKYNEPVPAILPDIQPHILPNSSVYSRRPNFEMYHSRSFDCEWSHSIEPNDFLSVETFIQWIEFNNSHSHARPKRFRANIRGFTSRPDILLFFLFEHFQQQNQPCPFEIIVSQFSDQMHLITNFCNKSVRNYVTNEVLESICFTDIGEKPSLVSTEDLLNPDYRNVDWV
uniref:Uncharacterized protein n=1 Tax=Ditylenchus dipsaci TaxID=166011 RepID=A0A915ETT3_9BILA